MSLFPVFTLDFKQKIIPRLVSVGYFDGKQPCLTCGSATGKVLVHNPHSANDVGSKVTAGVDKDISLLNINQALTTLQCGRLQGNNDLLVVGTSTNLIAYDVHNNRDFFFKETPDGVNALTVGRLGSYEQPMAIIGGNCSIQGYNQDGEDIFWTVTGDNVSALTLIDYSGDGKNELIAGSEDFDIRVFRDDEIIAEMTETEVITYLCGLEGNKFGYALSNGTVGVYEKGNRNWRIKSKNVAIIIHPYDINEDGVKELVTGWSNGKVDARSDRTGEVLFKENFPSAVAGVLSADYRQEGKELLICCSVDGEVRALHSSMQKVRAAQLEQSQEQESLRELSQRKQNLQMELKNYEENQKAGTMQRPSGLGHLDQQQMGIIPANTQLQTTLTLSRGSSQVQPHVELLVSTTNDTIIKAVIVFAEGIFEGESFVVHPQANQLSSKLVVPIVPPKDMAVDLHIKAFVGNKNSTQFHVFELTRQLPRFSMYDLMLNDEKFEMPSSFVTYQIKERVNRVVMWLNESFLLNDDIEAHLPLKLDFLSLRGSGPFVIRLEQNGQMTVQTDDMDLAGDFVQAIANALNIENLASTCDFPIELESLRLILSKVEEFHSTRQKLTSEMADHSNLIRSLVVRAEDSRLIGDMKSMKEGYVELLNLNKDLINGYKIRSNNHQELLSCLKQVNLTIQKAGKLRIGRHKTDVVNACRNAIKTNNVTTLCKLIKSGV